MTRARYLGLLLAAFALTATMVRAAPPGDLPRYGLDMRFERDKDEVACEMTVDWTNRANVPTQELVFNVHSHFKPPKEDLPLFAKTLEIMRCSPSTSLDSEGEACRITKVTGGKAWGFLKNNPTALRIELDRIVQPGETVGVTLAFTMRLPRKTGRWGRWHDVTFLAQWHPVLAYYDETGWQPTTFVPWHQPFFNEAGNYRVTVTLPRDQVLACTGAVVRRQAADEAQERVEIEAAGVRDFALLYSARYKEFVEQVGDVKVRVCAFAEYEHHAKEMVRIAREAITAYSRWFGPYPYPEFTIAQGEFGWLGNECSTLVMIDERVFGMPKMAKGYVDYLVSHEICHQWWYNQVGTNGYCETWMDEALATHFSHRLQTEKYGKNNDLIDYPKYLRWLPNIQRDTYRIAGWYGTLGRNENAPAVQEMEKYGHVINLFANCYEKGGKIVGLIAERLGQDAFDDFIRRVFVKYQYRILRVTDFRRELEDYSGRSWEQFFKDWLYGPGATDWAVEKVKLSGPRTSSGATFLDGLHGTSGEPCEATVIVHCRGDIPEPTILGLSFDTDDNYPLRLPIDPQAGPQRWEHPDAAAEPLPDGRVRVRVVLPARPRQIMVDPDQALVDTNPTNNRWKPELRVRVTPLYTFLDETDMTTCYDRWNIVAGPWFYDSTYNDAWYGRSPMAGMRAGVFRTEHLSAGVYAAYRTDYRDLVPGCDAVCRHDPWCPTEFGFNAEKRLTSVMEGSNRQADRAAVYGRYVFQYGSSFYLPPMQFVEAFAATQDNFLPNPRIVQADAERFERLNTVGLHYHLDYLTPYWDPEGGFRVEASYQGGLVDLRQTEAVHLLNGEAAYVQAAPAGLGWLSETKLALRGYVSAGLPDKGQYFNLGGTDRLRGFDMAQKQGSLLWVANVEWRVPVCRHVCWDVLDHCLGVREVNVAAFYDVGDALVHGHSNGPVAHAVGLGLRLDTALFGFVERTSLRFDVAKTLNYDSPIQFWVGFTHPF